MRPQLLQMEQDLLLITVALRSWIPISCYPILSCSNRVLSEDCVSTDQGETLNTGAIVGGIVGGVCVLLIFTSIITVVILVRMRKLKIFRYD